MNQSMTLTILEHFVILKLKVNLCQSLLLHTCLASQNFTIPKILFDGRHNQGAAVLPEITLYYPHLFLRSWQLQMLFGFRGGRWGLIKLPIIIFLIIQIIQLHSIFGRRQNTLRWRHLLLLLLDQHHPPLIIFLNFQLVPPLQLKKRQLQFDLGLENQFLVATFRHFGGDQGGGRDQEECQT